MGVLVLGAGVIGLTTAYYLQQAGHDVTVVDRHRQVAAETSFANGAQLSYSYVAPLAGPGVLSKVPKWFLDANAPMRFRPTFDIDLWRWCARFVRACTEDRSMRTTRQLLSLSFLSRDLMQQLMADEPSLQFDYARSGKLVLHRDALAFQQARALLAFQRSLGCEQEALDPGACVALEPALARVRREIAGGIYTKSEDTADCHRFCVALAHRLRERGVRFSMGVSVTGLSKGKDGRVSAIAADGTRIDSAQIVVAMGSDSAALLKSVGLPVPLYPLKGYSLTVSTQHRAHGMATPEMATSAATAPTISVTDFARKVVYARLGDRLRIAGMADLGKPSLSLEPDRLATLRHEAEALFPDAGDYDRAIPWAGLRPATPTGRPIIGQTALSNLWINIGHGALGFTLATGCAKLLSDRLSGVPAAIDDAPFSHSISR